MSKVLFNTLKRIDPWWLHYGKCAPQHHQFASIKPFFKSNRGRFIKIKIEDSQGDDSPKRFPWHENKDEGREDERYNCQRNFKAGLFKPIPIFPTY